MATARASDLPLLNVSGADSPRSRIGRGLESIGGMTADTLQRLSTAVGGVVKSPVVLMAKVGGLASPRAATLTAPPGSTLEERVFHLEIQMKSFEEKLSSRIVVTELDLSSHSHKQKPRIAKSLLQEMETERMLVKRVQMLEDRVNERMERIEKALSSIQSQLDHDRFSRRENVARYEHQESLSGEPQYYDAEQQSDDFEALEAPEQNFLGAHDVSSEAIGSSSTLGKSCVKETSFIVPTTAEHVQPLQEFDAGKNDDLLEPLVVSTPVYSKEAFVTHPMKYVAPSNEPAESIHTNDDGKLPASLDQQLASTLEELHGSSVMESSVAATSAKFLEIARADIAEKSTLVHVSSEPQFAYVLEEPQEAFLEEPSVAVLVAKYEEHAQEDVVDESGSAIATAKLPSPPIFDATPKDFVKSPLAVAANAKYAEELTTQEDGDIALASFEPLVTSDSVEEPSMVVPRSNFEEPTQDIGDKSVTMTAFEDSPKAFAFHDPHENFVKESLASAPGVGPTHEPSSQEDLDRTSDMTFASSESLVASKPMEEPSAVALGANFEDLVQENIIDKSGNTIAVAELPLAFSLEEIQEESAKEFMATAPSNGSAQVLATQKDNDMQVADPKSQMASKFVEEPLATKPSVDFEEPSQEDIVEKTDTMMSAIKSSLVFSLEEPKDGFEKESVAFASSSEPAREHSDMAIASSETKGVFKFVDEASIATLSANFGEHAHKDDVDESGTIIVGAKSPSAPSLDAVHEDFEKESSIGASSAEPAQELATQENNSMALASPETILASKFAKEPSTALVSVGFEEPACEDANKCATMTTTAKLPLPTLHQGLQEYYEKESLADAPSVGPIYKPSLQEYSGATSDKALAFSKTQVASKFVEEPLSVASSANFEEHACKDEVDKSVTMIATADSPLVPSYQGPHEDFVKESLPVVPSVGPVYETSSLKDLGAASDVAPTSSTPPGGSKFVEEPSPSIRSANSEEPIQEDGGVKSDIVIGGVKSPLASSFEEPQEDFEKESMAILSIEPAQELTTREESDMVPPSSEPRVASKFVEEPSVAESNANFEELAHENDVDKSITMSVAGEDPQKDFVKESLVAPPNIGLVHELSLQEDLDATNDMAFDSSPPHFSSKFVEKPLLAIPSANFEESVQDEDDVKNDTMSASVDSPSASSFEEPFQDLEKESLAATSSCEPTQRLATKENSHMPPTSSKSQEASKFMEEPSAAIPSANFEEPAHEDAVEKSVAMTIAGLSPLASSFEGSQEDFEKESIASAPNTKLAKELTAQEDSDTTPSKPQVASKIVEEDNHPVKESEYKIAKDFKVHDEHIKSIEKEFPRSPSNLDHVGSVELKLENLAIEDNNDRMESDQSGEEFFDAKHGSGNFEPWESVEPKSSEEFGIGPYKPGEAMGINVVAQKETLIPASSVKPAQECEQAPAREVAQELEQTPVRELEQDHESTEQVPAQEQELVHGQIFAQEHEQHYEQELERQSAQELEQEDLTRNSAMALLPLERQITSKSGESQELLAKESSTKFEEPTIDLPLTSTVEEPQIDTVVSPDKNLSSALFHQSNNPELLKSLEHKSSDVRGTSSIAQETVGREPLIATPTTEIAHQQGHDDGKSDNVHISLEPQLEESNEALVNEPMKAIPSFESIEAAQEVDDKQSGDILASSNLQLTPTLQKPHEGFVEETLANAKSAPKSLDLEESLVDETSAMTTSAMLAQESIADKISVGLVEEQPLTSIAEEPHNGSMSSPMEGKHGHDEPNQKFLEDVKNIVEPIEEGIPRQTQSDLTHVKLKPEAVEDATKLQSQGSSLEFGDTSEDSKEALGKEPLPSTKLLELFEEENHFGKKDPMLVESPMTSKVEEPQKLLAKELLAGAKSVPKGHARRRGFARSSSEPQFAYKLEEYRKALVKESSVAAVPSASKLGEEHAQEDFADTQCLPFRILGEGKHPRKESEFKLVEDVKSPMMKSETTLSYVLEPTPSKIKEKKKKEKKPDATAEEKERRLSLGLGEMERKSSLRGEEKDSKYSPRVEEKHKQPFRHLRERLRHAFSVNKEP